MVVSPKTNGTDSERLSATASDLAPETARSRREIGFEFEGAPAFFDADVIKALKITSDQRTKMQSIYRESTNAAQKEYPAFADPAHLSKEQQRAMLEKTDAIQKTLLDKFLKLLLREQRANMRR